MRAPGPLEIPVAPAAGSPAQRLLLLGVPALILLGAFLPGPDGAPAPRSLLLLLLSALAVLLGLLFWLAPRRLGYALTDTDLLIRRLSGTTRLAIPEITARRSAGRLGWRTFGTGLPGYLTGSFTFGPDVRSAVMAAASRPDGGVIAEHAGRAHFLTPADPDAFLSELARRGATVAR